MCGICGFFLFDPSTDHGSLDAIARMNALMAHRGPDGQGIHASSSRRAYLGHRRLSIIDVEGGGQPLSNEDDSIWIVFNGEIYNFAELRQNLESCGHRFKTNTDTEVIVHAYEEWGSQAVQRLRGMFAFAVWDEKRQRLFCARDRLGIKPFYYSVSAKSFVFASEIKAVLAHPTVSRELEASAFVNFLRLLYIPAPQTIYKGIFKLPPAHTLTVYPEGVELNCYWRLADKIPSPSILSENEAAAALRALLDEAVGSHLVSDVPLGAFLSGGVDSSSIVGIMSTLSTQPVMSHCVSFTDRAHDESQYARQMATRFKCDHLEVDASISVDSLLSKLIWHLDEPFADSSAIPTFYVCREARRRVTVSLSGDGGDELFAGYDWYRSILQVARLKKYLPALIGKCTDRLADLLPSNIRGRTYLQNLAGGTSANHFNLVKGFSDDQILSMVRPELIPEGTLPANPIFTAHSGLGAYADPILQSQIVDISTYMVEDILMKVDKMSMANSLEVRVPFLDHKVVEFAFSVPTHFKIDLCSQKKILKMSLEDLIPREFFNRRKQGFSVPLKSWLKHDLNSFAHDTLLSQDARVREFVHPLKLKTLWSGLDSSSWSLDVSQQIWALLCFEVWHRTYLG